MMENVVAEGMVVFTKKLAIYAIQEFIRSITLEPCDLFEVPTYTSRR
jgi:hypothetical protein